MIQEKFKKPSVTADIIVQDHDSILLIERKREPYKGCWALPGGFLDVDEETVAQTAKRELEEETNLKVNLEDLELIGETSAPNRDPRGHIVSLIYVAKDYTGNLKAGDDAANAKFFPIDNLPPLAFDHNIMMDKYNKWRKKWNQNQTTKLFIKGI